MKNINEYIKLNKSDNYTPSLKFSNEFFYEEIKDFYGEDNIPNDLKLLYENRLLVNFKYEYINENLQTHDYKKLQNKLLEYYKDDIENFKEYDGSKKIKSFWIILKNNNKKINIKDLRNHSNNIEEFFNLLNFFNYTYREWEKIENKICLFIEPIYSEDATEYFNKCHRQAYHFTYKKNVENILNNGIRLKEKDSLIRYPKRIYIWATDKKISKSEINNFIKTLFSEEFDENKIAIIKIDLHNTDYPVYKDTAMKDKEALFIYNSIPANLCKEIKISNN